MKKMALLVVVMSSISVMKAMDMDSVAQAKKNSTIPGKQVSFCCYRTSAVPACYQCAEKGIYARNDKNEERVLSSSKTLSSASTKRCP